MPSAANQTAAVTQLNFIIHAEVCALLWQQAEYQTQQRVIINLNIYPTMLISTEFWPSINQPLNDFLEQANHLCKMLLYMTNI